MLVLINLLTLKNLTHNNIFRYTYTLTTIGNAILKYQLVLLTPMLEVKQLITTSKILRTTKQYHNCMHT